MITTIPGFPADCMIVRMKNIISALAIALWISGLAAALQSPSAQDSGAQTVKSKSKVKAPKAISLPDPDGSFYDKVKQPAKFKVQVGTDGLIHQPALVQSSGNADADAAALAAISRWKFKPATQDGVPVPVFINVEVYKRL
jgi:TonB family protein